MSRRIAIDYGRKRVGLAISDESGLAITPLPHLESSQTFWQDLETVIKEYGVHEIILGYPEADIGEEQAESKLTAETQQFARALKHKFRDLNLHLWDESFSSQTAEQMRPRKGKRTAINRDSIAAAVILRSFIEAQSD